MKNEFTDNTFPHVTNLSILPKYNSVKYWQQHVSNNDNEEHASLLL